MIRRIVLVLIAFIAIALIVFWVIGGGPRHLIEGTQGAFSTVTKLGTDAETDFALPWQPAQLFPTLDITELLNFSADTDTTSLYQGESPDYDSKQNLEDEYDSLRRDADELHLAGIPSPYAGKVDIAATTFGFKETTTAEEYVEISADFTNTEEIDITGWTIESALSGTRAIVPPGVSVFSSNSPNTVGRVKLAAGMRAIIASGPSPISVSFHENMCSGYLAQYHEFTPNLSTSCPSPRETIPLSGTNLQRYGESCFDAINALESCRFPERLPAEITSICRSHVQDVLSYSGCVRDNHFRSSFFTDTWRIYIGAPRELWRNSHDVIRLLDAQGRTVSVFVY